MEDEQLAYLEEDDVLEILAAKAKEVKSLTKKLKKLEERYVSAYRENQAHLKDLETFEAFLQIIFPNNYDAVKKDEIGGYELSALEAAFEERENEKREAIQIMSQSHKDRVAELDHECKNLRDILGLKDHEENELTTLRREKVTLTEKNEALQNELDRHSQELTTHETTISHLRDIEKEHARLKADALLNVLNQHRTDTEESEGSTSKSAGYQSLTNTLQKKNSEIETLEDKVKSLNQEVNNLKAMTSANLTLSKGIQTDFIGEDYQHAISDSRDASSGQKERELEKTIESLRKDIQEQKKFAHKLLLEKEGDITKLKQQLAGHSNSSSSSRSKFGAKLNYVGSGGGGAAALNQTVDLGYGMNSSSYSDNSLKESFESQMEDYESTIQLQEEQNRVLKERIRELENSQDRKSLNIDYIKNLIVKYMEYVAANDHKGARRTQEVIFAALQFRVEETKAIEGMQKSSSIWSYASNLLTGKPQSHYNKRQKALQSVNHGGLAADTFRKAGGISRSNSHRPSMDDSFTSELDSASTASRIPTGGEV